MRPQNTSQAFSFIEILIGVIILSVGLIPLLSALSGGTRQTAITLRQVQAANHASNLMEGLRATKFQDITLFPPCMVQLKGGDNTWRKPSEASEVELILPELANQPPPSGSTGVFDAFRNDFFAKDNPIVPPLSSRFSRYFVILKDDEKTPKYITIIVRVEWDVKNRLKAKGGKMQHRHVELRTVIADPYFCDS